MSWEAGEILPRAASQRALSFVERNSHRVASARLLLAIVTVLMLPVVQKQPWGAVNGARTQAWGATLLLFGYALWVSRSRHAPFPRLSRITPWLDVLLTTGLIYATGAIESPFFLWSVFVIMGAALQCGWRTAVRVSLTQIVLFIAMTTAHGGRSEMAISHLAQTTHLFVISLTLAYMGQRLLEHSGMLAALHNATTYMSAGSSVPDILARLADSTADLLEAEHVAIGIWHGDEALSRPILLNLDRAQGERLIEIAGSRVAQMPTDPSSAVISNSPRTDPDFAQAGEALDGIRSLLMAPFGCGHDFRCALLACNRSGGSGFTPVHGEMAELLASHVSALLKVARLQVQRRYSASLDERRRIAADLHDGLIQVLSSLDLRLLTCTRLWQSERRQALGEELVVLKRMAEEALREARGAINQIAPARLYENGLTAYLEDCIQRFQERASVRVDADLDFDETAIPEPTALLLIGLVREGLNNIRKYAHASRVTLSITGTGDQVALRLADDGVGFDPRLRPPAGMPTHHYGLASLQERITKVGGVLRVISRPGEGTLLTAWVPILSEGRLVSLLSTAPEDLPSPSIQADLHRDEDRA